MRNTSSWSLDTPARSNSISPRSPHDSVVYSVHHGGKDIRPRSPLPWIWTCHECSIKYRFRATSRCLNCSHRFCTTCVSELDYPGWSGWDRYWSTRNQHIAQVTSADLGALALRPRGQNQIKLSFETIDEKDEEFFDSDDTSDSEDRHIDELWSAWRYEDDVHRELDVKSLTKERSDIEKGLENFLFIEDKEEDTAMSGVYDIWQDPSEDASQTASHGTAQLNTLRLKSANHHSPCITFGSASAVWAGGILPYDDEDKENLPFFQ